MKIVLVCAAGASTSLMMARMKKFAKEGDVIEIRFGTRTVKAEVLDVQETVRKEEAKELYRYL